MNALLDWLFYTLPIWLMGIIILLLLWGAMRIGVHLRHRLQAREGITADDKDSEDSSSHEGYIVSGTLGLMALLLGFTFSLAINRYDQRRAMVLEESNAIGTTYLRAQLLDEPYRTQLSNLLETYTENRLALAVAHRGPKRDALVTQSDTLQTQMWTATVAAVHPIRNVMLSSTFVEAMNATIDAGAARFAARRAHVPSRVMAVLLFYMVISAFVLGYVLSRSRRHTATLVQLGLVTVAFLLILDIDRPVDGSIGISQAPMEDLLASIRHTPPAAYGVPEGAAPLSTPAALPASARTPTP